MLCDDVARLAAVRGKPVEFVGAAASFFAFQRM